MSKKFSKLLVEQRPDKKHPNPIIDPRPQLDKGLAEMQGYLSRPPLFAKYAQKDKTQDLIDLYANELYLNYAVNEQEMVKVLTRFAEALSESGPDSF